jgi:hypothetical protein
MPKTVRALATAVAILSVAAVGTTIGLPMTAQAQLTCNTFIDIAINPLGAMAVGDTKTVTLGIGTGEIQGGTKVTISHIRYDLDCDADLPLGLPCTDQGDIFRYEGDGTISTTCGVSWTSNVPAGGSSINSIVFTPSSPIDIPANINPFCTLSFGIRLENEEPTMGAQSDMTPTLVEEVTGFSGSDATCDNTLPSQGSQTASVPVAPLPCGDGVITPPETCEPPGSPQPPFNNPCRGDCTYCGDGILNGPASGPGYETCDPGDPNLSLGCYSDCTGKLLRDPETIKFKASRANADRWKMYCLILPGRPVDPSADGVIFRLSNANGVIYTAQLSPGQLIQDGKRFIYKNKIANTNPLGGVAFVQFMPHRPDRSPYARTIKIVTYGDLSKATLQQMTVEIMIGSAYFVHSANWMTTRSGGWVDFGKEELHP